MFLLSVQFPASPSPRVPPVPFVPVRFPHRFASDAPRDPKTPRELEFESNRDPQTSTRISTLFPSPPYGSSSSTWFPSPPYRSSSSTRSSNNSSSEVSPPTVKQEQSNVAPSVGSGRHVIGHVIQFDRDLEGTHRDRSSDSDESSSTADPQPLHPLQASQAFGFVGDDNTGIGLTDIEFDLTTPRPLFTQSPRHPVYGNPYTPRLSSSSPIVVFFFLSFYYY